MRILQKTLLLIGLLLLASCVKNKEATEHKELVADEFEQQVPVLAPFPNFNKPRIQKEFPAYIALLKQYALDQHIEESVVNSAFAKIHFVKHVIQADRNQLEKKITLDDYLKRTLPDSRVSLAKQKYQDYKPQLSIATSRYGVPERYIVALWGLESGFGKSQGKEDVISALASLAFEGRREVFFVNELMAALMILQQGTMSIDQLKGSWAGAMGQCQFMPSSYLKYGSDGDGDGYIDIWSNPDDVFSSTANYLAAEGWIVSMNWGKEISLPANFNHILVGLENSQAKTPLEWQKLNVKLIDGSIIPDISQKTWVILPDGIKGRAFLVTENFKAIMHWNRSYYFALSVSLLADKIIRQ